MFEVNECVFPIPKKITPDLSQAFPMKKSKKKNFYFSKIQKPILFLRYPFGKIMTYTQLFKYNSGAKIFPSLTII